MATERKAFLLALAAVLLWSTVATAFKITLSYMSPLQMVTAASVVSWLFLMGILVAQGRVGELIPELRRYRGYYLLLGLLNPLVYYLILFEAYRLLPASQAQPLNYTWAIALTLMAGLFLGQTIRKRDWVACAMGYLGVLFIATQGDIFSLSFTSPLGVGLALLSTFLWAGYWILNTRHQAEPVLTLALCFGVAIPFALVASFIWSDWSEVPWQGWVAVSYVGLFEMGLTFVLWLKAMKLTQNTAKISNLIFISPFISLALLALIIGEVIHPSTIFGLLLIIAGLVIQQWRRRTRVAGEG
ncbi:DMT family transporter [Aliidiomarina indica]|uniref:DMT family transporter n=1 Tax=Aliidiomarina indica TaxID=2749147 RepID=UPI0018907F1E|nr:DMT family transporter [Aliidiomarina indica]